MATTVPESLKRVFREHSPISMIRDHSIHINPRCFGMQVGESDFRSTPNAGGQTRQAGILVIPLRNYQTILPPPARKNFARIPEKSGIANDSASDRPVLIQSRCPEPTLMKAGMAADFRETALESATRTGFGDAWLVECRYFPPHDRI